MKEWKKDLDFRMLCLSFDALVDFIEVECAHAYLTEETENYKRSFFSWGWRNPEAGKLFILKHRPNTASEIVNLYAWWKLRKQYNEKYSYSTDSENLKRLVNVRSSLWV